MQLNSTCGLSTKKEGASKSIAGAGKDAQRTSPQWAPAVPGGFWDVSQAPKAIHLQIPLITVLHTGVDNDGGAAVYHFMFNAKGKAIRPQSVLFLIRAVSLPPEEGHRVKASFLRGGHRVGTHSRSGFPKWGVGPSLQAPLKPFWLLSVQDKELLTCQHLAGRDLLLSFRINFLVQIL